MPSKRPTKHRRTNRRCATPEQALEVADALDREGDEEGKRLAAEIRRQVAELSSHTRKPDDERPAPWALWCQAGGSIDEPGAADAAVYIALMVAHGYRIRREHKGPIERDEFLHLYNDARLTAFEGRPVGGGQVTYIDHAKGEAVSTGWVCPRGSRGHSPCQDCKHYQHEFLCDFETGEPCGTCKGKGEREEPVSYFKTIVELVKCRDCEGTGNGTCGRRLCRHCRTKFGKKDICKAHKIELRRRAGISDAGGKPIDVRWLRVDPPFQCWRCQRMTYINDLYMYFPKQGKGMCEACGDVGVQQGKVNPLNTKEDALKEPKKPL